MEVQLLSLGSLDKFFWAIFDCADEVFHLDIPFVHSSDKNLEMVHGEVSWHDPVNLNGLINLINATTDELEWHSFHNKHLDFVDLHFALVSELSKRQAALIFATVEEELKERQNANLLIEIWHLFHDSREASNEVLMTRDSRSKLSDLTFAQSHQKIIEPLEVSSNKTAQNLFIEELWYVEDVLA